MVGGEDVEASDATLGRVSFPATAAGVAPLPFRKGGVYAGEGGLEPTGGGGDVAVKLASVIYRPQSVFVLGQPVEKKRGSLPQPFSFTGCGKEGENIAFPRRDNPKGRPVGKRRFQPLFQFIKGDHSPNSSSCS
jgi:hypothetical protein